MCQDGCFKIPINDTRFDWCSARNTTLEVTVTVTNKAQKSTASSISYMAPSLDLNATDSGVSASCVPGGFGQVAVTFSSTLFRWSWKRPDFYRIVVMEGQSDLSRTCNVRELPLDRTMIKGVVTTLERPFLATDARWNPFKGTNSTEVTFIIGGSDNVCNSTDSSTYAALFCNRALTPGKVYTVFVQAVIAVPHMIVTAPLVAVTVRFDGLADEDKENILRYITFLAVPVGIVNFILFVKFLRQCHRYKCRRPERRPNARRSVVHSPDAPLEHISHNDRAWVGVPEPVTERQFRQLCEDMPQDIMCPQLLRQFEALCALSSQVAASTPSRVGNLPTNACKNRYANIIPFDKNRVLLLSYAPNDNVSNYINASHIVGFSGWPEYIAAQGPKDNTVKDFWVMAYEQNVRTVVMLTNLVENGKVKCHQYYPELGDRFTWGDLSVACCVQNDLLFYTLRTIVMTKGSEERLVNHLHFREWPDFGCPASPKHVLQFCITLRRQAVLFPGMIVVHCSAGVGRTGTLIALDILLQCLKAKKKIDVFGVVLKLREQRPCMVQCQEQYCFLMKCLRVALDDPIIRKYKPPAKGSKGSKKAAELQTVALQVFQKSFQCKK
ncbi:receptor-type tyrosine-protein phosphatase alpha-like [Thrips palmi]|uniref:protein-tyrosine-phosphatase n=1 Tax=Thrips palmi TaxID=161013 RepID=A0A6P8YPM0_THRPL|nr:receptor-type tyrosine-protein phosphatase alpha-like [Thrips palmi]